MHNIPVLTVTDNSLAAGYEKALTPLLAPMRSLSEKQFPISNKQRYRQI